MIYTENQPLPMGVLADDYAKCAINACFVGAELEKAARCLKAGRLGAAEVAIRQAIDRLALLVAEMPRIEM